MAEDEDAARRRALSPLLAVSKFRPPSATVTVEFAARSHAGLSQSNHEDHYLIQRFTRSQDTISTSLPNSDLPRPFDEYAYAMLIADGVGGKGAGALAGRIALSTLAHLAMHFGHWMLRVDAQTAQEIMARGEWYYRRVHEVLREKGGDRAETAGMATSLTAAYSAGDDLFVAHVGHSRAYMFRQGEIRQLTRDHTVARRLADGARAAEVTGVRDQGHLLTDTLGGSNVTPHIAIDRHQLLHGDCVMVCTDGLTDLVTPDRIAEVLTLRRSLEEQCRRLIDLALDSGGDDNVTVMLAQYSIPLE
jgi:serine/threonine protein phosphatase PrpC